MRSWELMLIVARSVRIVSTAFVLATTVAVLPGSAGGGALGQGPNATVRAEGGSCSLPPPAEESSEWRSTDAAEAALSRIGEASIAWFGDPEKDNWIQQRNGYIGVAPDDAAQVVNIVLDVPASETAGYQSRFQEAAGDAIKVVVVQPCNSGPQLAAAGDRLPALIEREEGAAFFADVDVRTATITVWLYAKTQAVRTEFAEATAGGLIQIVQVSEPPTLQAGNRFNDSQPHWGGAAIENHQTQWTCSSGFAVDTAHAGKAMITAGHCGGINDSFDSGSYSFGPVARKADFPERDMLIINGASQNYDDDIYMSPTTSIDVSGTRVVVQSNHVCLSGRTQGPTATSQ